MERSLFSIAALGAAVSASVGALAGAGLRVDPPAPRPWESPAVDFRPISFEPAPAYPLWAPPPLYGRSEDTAADAFGAWVDRLADLAPPSPRPVSFEPPEDLPPPYEVRLTVAAPAPPAPPPAHRAAAPVPPPPREPQPIRVSTPPSAARAWIDPEGQLYVEAPPPPPAALSGPPIDRAQLFF